jgi:multisubunit Na+/H+ antiporter MnhG subunit
MADLHLMTVLSGMLAAPCAIALTQGTDKTTKIFASAGVVVGAWLGLYRYVDFLDQLTTPTLVTVLGVLALLLAVIIAIRLKHQILGTLMITAGTLMALLALGVAR